jgi:hypothetical protein
MNLQTWISSVPQRNRSALLLNHEIEGCMKEEYAITYIYLFHETKCMEKYNVYSESQVVIRDIIVQIFHNFI